MFCHVPLERVSAGELTSANVTEAGVSHFVNATDMQRHCMLRMETEIGIRQLNIVGRARTLTLFGICRK